MRGPLRGGLSEVLGGFKRFSEVFQRPSQSPSQSAIFLSELRVLLLLIVLPLKAPATDSRRAKVTIENYLDSLGTIPLLPVTRPGPLRCYARRPQSFSLTNGS